MTAVTPRTFNASKTFGANQVLITPKRRLRPGARQPALEADEKKVCHQLPRPWTDQHELNMKKERELKAQLLEMMRVRREKQHRRESEVGGIEEGK